MADARASLLLAAEDATAAAFNSANRNLATLERRARSASSGLSASFSSARSALAFLGVALSGRAFLNWITHTVKAAEVTGEHAEQIKRAKEALDSMKRASDELALSLGVKLVPALTAVAIGWNRILTRADPFPFEAAINSAAHRLDVLQDKLAAMERFGGFRFADRDQLVADIAAAQAALDQLNLKQEQALGLGAGGLLPKDELTGFDEKAIGRRRMAVDEIGAMLRQKAEEQRLAAIQYERELVDAVALERERFAGVEREAAEEAMRVAHEETERRRELLARQIEDVQEYLRTEEESEIEAHARRQEMLRAAHEEQLIEKQRYYQLSEELAAKSEQNIADIRAREHQRERQMRAQTVANVAGLFTALAIVSAAGANESKKKFEQDKKIQTAAAIVNTLAGVTQALSSAPYPINLINAAVVAAFGFAQVKQIRSTTWSGGGAGGLAGGGSVGASASVPAANESNFGLGENRDRGRSSLNVNVIVQGSVIGEGGRTALAEDLTKLLRDHTERTDDTLVTVTSRNGIDLARTG